MTTHPMDARILNALVATLLASIADYRRFSSEVADGALARRFDVRADEQRRAAAKLQSAVAEGGGEPEYGGSLLSGIRPSSIARADETCRSNDAICNEIQRNEDRIREGFAKAFADIELSPEARATVREAWELVKFAAAEPSGFDRPPDVAATGIRSGLTDR